MSNLIPTIFTKQFGDNLTHLAQQRGTRLRRGMGVIVPIKGQVAFVDQIGPAPDPLDVTTRHGDSPQLNTPFGRRRLTPQDVDWGDLIDDFDRIKMLADPTSPTAMAAGWSMGRRIDDIAIAAFFGTAYSGVDGATSVSFPAGNTVAVDFDGANSGLTVAKLREARRLLLAGNVDPQMDGPLFIGVTAKQLDNLLGTTEVTSSDFNTVKALVQGDINTFLGFNFIHTERLLVDASSYRRLPVWAATGMAMGFGMEPMARISERADKKFSMYVYYRMSVGATRLEETKVMEILADETV